MEEIKDENFPKKEELIYTEWELAYKNAYIEFQLQENQSNQENYHDFLAKKHEAINSILEQKYKVNRRQLEQIIDKRDIARSRNISTKEIEMADQVVKNYTIDMDELIQKLEIAKDFEVSLYELDEAMKKSFINRIAQ